ncbi:MAG: YbbR-like domain-containing protein [Nitrospirae bacterium]|nr:YbbR-like domain-containing protein [Nitrospirota bacterium]
MKAAILNNIWLKLLSIVISCSLWFFVTYRGQSEIMVDVPIEIKNMPASMEILRQNTKSISLSVSGQERLLKGLKPMDIRIVADMSNTKKGENVYYFDNGNVITSRSIKVLRIDPPYVKFVVDQSLKKSFNVEPVITGTPAKGFKVEHVEVVPRIIEAEGPKSELERMAVLRTDQIDITSLDSSISPTVHINTNGKNIRLKNQEVTVKIQISGAKR